MFAYTIELSHDATELSLLSSTEFLPTGFFSNLTAGTANGGLCSGLMFDAVDLPGTGVAGRFAILSAMLALAAALIWRWRTTLA